MSKAITNKVTLNKSLVSYITDGSGNPTGLLHPTGGTIPIGTSTAYATPAALETAFPSAANKGMTGLVGTSAPYTEYVSNGSAWVQILNPVLDTTNRAVGFLSPDGSRSPTPYTLAISGIPIGMPPSGFIGNNGALKFGNANSSAGSLSFASTAAGAGVVVTGTGTAFASTDVNRVLVVDGTTLCTITAFSSTTSVTVTIPTGGILTTAYANAAWTMAAPTFATFSAGCYLYFSAGALYSGSVAGSYWTIMSSPVAGTVYNNMMSSGVPRAPASATPIVATGPGIYTTTTVETVLLSIVLPGGTLGLNGALRGTMWVGGNNNSNSKTFRQKYNGTNGSGQNVASVVYQGIQQTIQNAGSLTTQYLSGGTGTDMQQATTIFTSTANTALDTVVGPTLQMGSSLDCAFIYRSVFEVFPT